MKNILHETNFENFAIDAARTGKSQDKEILHFEEMIFLPLIYIRTENNNYSAVIKEENSVLALKNKQFVFLLFTLKQLEIQE